MNLGYDYERTEIRSGMKITWQIPLCMDDGVVLRADLFQPVEGPAVPVIMSYGCYAKGQAFQEAYASQWQSMVEEFPEIETGSSNAYQCWELTDPERWVPHGYAVLRVDSRGPAGRKASRISGRNARPWITGPASSGPENSPGATAT